MFITHWTESMPRYVHNALVVRDMFTSLDSGDPLHPLRKGAVLTELSNVSRASLAAGCTTGPVSLEGEQEILYIYGGSGAITANGMVGALHSGVGVLIPPDLTFSLSADADNEITMYRIVEKVPTGFQSNKNIIVRDEKEIPLLESNGHWANVAKTLFWKDSDNLTTIVGMNPVWIFPGTMAQPHSHEEGVEEIWIAVDGGQFDVLLGKELRRLRHGSAYKVPTTGITAHSNINVSNKPIKLLWFMKINERN